MIVDALKVQAVLYAVVFGAWAVLTHSWRPLLVYPLMVVAFWVLVGVVGYVGSGIWHLRNSYTWNGTPSGGWSGWTRDAMGKILHQAYHETRTDLTYATVLPADQESPGRAERRARRRAWDEVMARCRADRRARALELRAQWLEVTSAERASAYVEGGVSVEQARDLEAAHSTT